MTLENSFAGNALISNEVAETVADAAHISINQAPASLEIPQVSISRDIPTGSIPCRTQSLAMKFIAKDGNKIVVHP